MLLRGRVSASFSEEKEVKDFLNLSYERRKTPTQNSKIFLCGRQIGSARVVICRIDSLLSYCHHIETSGRMKVPERRSSNPSSSRWSIPFASAIALVFGNAPVSLYSFGVFITPLETQFGWDRTTISGAIGLCALCSAISLPIIGFLMDKWGVKPVLLTAICLYGVNLATIGLSNHPVDFVLLTALTGVTGAAQGPIGYVKIISGYFDKRRGLAIGIAMAGIGVGTALVPQYALWLISHFGWRAAYVGLSLGIILVAALAVLLCLRDPAPSRKDSLDISASPPEGLLIGEALASPLFWTLAFTVLLVATAVNGCLVHAVPLLIGRGRSPSAAASVMIWAGLATMAGRLLAGYLVDRFFAPYVGGVFFLLAAGGVYLLAANFHATLGIVSLGLAAGTEIDLIGYMSSRYFGLRKFGQLYGYLFAVFTIGSGLGPFLMGAAYGQSHSYDAALIGSGVMLTVASALILRLGPYRYAI